MIVIHFNRSHYASQARRRHFGSNPVAAYFWHVRGVARLVLSLRAVRTSLPIHLLVSGERYATPEQRLRSLGVRVLHAAEPAWDTPSWAADTWAAGTFAKLHALTLTDFTRVLVLDTDCVALRNFDHLVSRSALPALPGFVFGPQDGGAWGLMNSGVMVLRPDSGDFARVKGLMALRSLRSLDASDQSVWHALYRTFYELPAAYNVHGSSRWATSTSMSSNDSLSARSTSLDGFRDAFIVHAHRGRQVAHPLYVSRERRWRRQAEALLPGVRALEREGAMLGR